MADNEATGDTFSELMFDTDGFYNYNNSFSPQNPPNLLCFGDSVSKSPQEHSQFACKELDKPNKKRNGSLDISSSGVGVPVPVTVPVSRKRAKSDRSNVNGHGKGKREKLGERIAALQQLVSPYGKSDTASVLHEAMGYIKFLQDQVQVLCSPYLQVVGDEDGEQRRKDLKSMGLCLVPTECTSVVANNNGADFWSPAMTKKISPN